MSFQNLIVNGGFEIGTLFPWSGVNTTITSQFSHSGYFTVGFLGGTVTSYIAQFVPAKAGEGSEFLVSLAREGFLPAPSVTIQLLILIVNLISSVTDYLLLCRQAEYR
nr:NTTRR-F1 domain [Bacillus safensis]